MRKVYRAWHSVGWAHVYADTAVLRTAASFATPHSRFEHAQRHTHAFHSGVGPHCVDNMVRVFGRVGGARGLVMWSAAPGRNALHGVAACGGKLGEFAIPTATERLLASLLGSAAPLALSHVVRQGLWL